MADGNFTNVYATGNISAVGNIFGSYFTGNGAGLSNVTAANTAVTVTGSNQPNITSVGVLSDLSVYGTISTWDVAAGGAISAYGNVAGNYFIGDGSLLTNVNSGAGSASRITVSGTTGVLGPSASTNITIAGFKGYNLYGIQTSQPAWVTLYSSLTARAQDSSRPITTNPTPGTGVIAEVITTGPSIQYFTPGVVGFSTENPPTVNLQLKVVNTGILTVPITVGLVLVKTES